MYITQVYVDSDFTHVHISFRMKQPMTHEDVAEIMDFYDDGRIRPVEIIINDIYYLDVIVPISMPVDERMSVIDKIRQLERHPTGRIETLFYKILNWCYYV